MKILHKLFFIGLAVVVFAGCKKDEQRVNFLGGTPPVLTASSTSIPLSFATSAGDAITLSWTNPDYKLNTGNSSLDVTYLVEIDTAGANFTNPARESLSIGKDLSVTLTQSQLNDFLLNTMVLTPDAPHNIEIRVTSTLNAGSVPLMSNVLAFTIKPYSIPPKVQPPANGTLWIVGDAVASGWSNPLPPPYDGNQQFTRESNTLYDLVVTFVGTGGYKLIQIEGDWNSQYHAVDGTAALAGDFKMENADPTFPSPPAGTYKVTVDFQRGKYTLTKQ